MKDQSQLLLENQLCFPIYATSRMITRLYQPLLDVIGLTYPQYLVMLVMWEHENLSVSQLGNKLFLNTNTITPLLKKMELKGLIVKKRSSEDERTVNVSLTKSGQQLKIKALDIPEKLATTSNIPITELNQLRSTMWKMLNFIEK
ncbi:MarR family transcriptional regulator [bacterium SCSIO 12643]|nr:MarR family transcriptional regulator [bacterium SCSIO 12643]